MKKDKGSIGYEEYETTGNYFIFSHDKPQPFSVFPARWGGHLLFLPF